MCDVMPTISEDSISQRSSQFSGEDANFEQLMVSMLDERDKLMDSLRESQERLQEAEARLQEVEKERDALNRQINANIPQVYELIYSSFPAKLMIRIISLINLSPLDRYPGGREGEKKNHENPSGESLDLLHRRRRRPAPGAGRETRVNRGLASSLTPPPPLETLEVERSENPVSAGVAASNRSLRWRWRWQRPRNARYFEVY